MGIGRMNVPITIVTVKAVKDAEGFSTPTDIPLATVRAYREDRHGSERWANRAAFTTASVSFLFRAIPSVQIGTAQVIVCGADRFNIVSVENIKGRGMYIEALAERVTGSA